MATVIPYFHRFLQRFPALRDLAEAPEQEVLRLWQGLGYYSRARNLQAAARKIIDEFAGQVPHNAEDLLSLPGVGRYTAGAIASLAFDQRAPILDGNVIRVLCRLDRVESDPRQKDTLARLWLRAEEILPKAHCGDFNSALMELGALICTPRAPQCLICPVRQHCEAFAAGVQERLPLKRPRPQTPLEKRCTFCIHHAGEWLIEQRPSRGRWGGMWQFITLPQVDHQPVDLATVLGDTGVAVSHLERLGQVTHALTHRRYEFEIYRCQTTHKTNSESSRTRAWVTLHELDHYPLPRPHLKIAEMLRNSSP